MSSEVLLTQRVDLRRIMPVSLMALAAFALVLVASSPFGIGVTPDSIEYFSAAESLAAGQGLRGSDGQAFVTWPPLYPVLLSIGRLADVPVLELARWMQAATAAIVVGLVGGVVTARSGSLKLGIFAAAACLSAKPLLMVESFAWSEPTFIVFELITLAALSAHVRAPSIGKLLLVGAAAACACLTRYAGIVLVPVAVISLLILDVRSLRARIKDCLYFATITGAPLVLWMVRNRSLSDTLTGPRTSAARSLSVNLLDACRTIDSWLLPQKLVLESKMPDWLAVGILLAIVAAGAIVLGMALRWSEHVRAAEISTLRTDLVPLALFGGIYLTFTVAMASLTVMDHVGNRYLSPLAPPLVIAAVLAIQAVVRRAPSSRTATFRLRGAFAAGAIVLVMTTQQGTKTILYLARHGQGLTSRNWLARSVLKDTARLPRDSVVWSNHPGILRMLAGRAALPLSSDTELSTLTAHDSTSDHSTEAFVVWLNETYPQRQGLPTPEHLAERIGMTPCVEREDGAVYRLSQHAEGKASLR